MVGHRLILHQPFTRSSDHLMQGQPPKALNRKEREARDKLA